MPNVLFITPGPVKWASSRMRAHWVAECMEDAIVYEASNLVNAIQDNPKPDAVIYVKVAPALLEVPGAKTFWDLCDPVHWFSPDVARQMADQVDGIVCSNANLTDDFIRWYGSDDKVTTIPDRLKLSHYPKQKEHLDSDPVRFIWYGAGQNRFSLLGAAANLDRLVANGVNIELTICDDIPQQQWRFSDAFPTYHVNWSLETENEILSSHDIALLPPYPGPWGWVKDDNKKLTAIANGLIQTNGYDYDFLHMLATDWGLRQRQSQMTYWSLKTMGYNVEQSAKEWEALLWQK